MKSYRGPSRRDEGAMDGTEIVTASTVPPYGCWLRNRINITQRHEFRAQRRKSTIRRANLKRQIADEDTFGRHRVG